MGVEEKRPLRILAIKIKHLTSLADLDLPWFTGKSLMGGKKSSIIAFLASFLFCLRRITRKSHASDDR